MALTPRLKIDQFERTCRQLGEVDAIVSDAAFEPDVTPDRREELLAFRSWVRTLYRDVDQSNPAGWVANEARRRAAALLDRPDLLIGLTPERGPETAPGEVRSPLSCV